MPAAARPPVRPCLCCLRAPTPCHQPHTSTAPAAQDIKKSLDRISAGAAAAA